MTLDIGSQLPLAGQIVLSGYLHSEFSPPVSDRKLLMVHGRFASGGNLFEKSPQSAQVSLREKVNP